MSQRIAITGGSGKVGSLIRPALARADREILLLDLAEPPIPLTEGESFVAASVDDLPAISAAFQDADLVVHLAGFGLERPWREIVDTNITGGYSVLEAARLAGVRRVLLASSIHAVGFAGVDALAGSPELLPRPDTFYGVSKVATEALGRLYADRFGMTVVSARLGTVEARPSSIRSLGTWVSPADIARLVDAVATTTVGGGHVVWGISANSAGLVDHSAGAAIGFHPRDDAAEFARDIRPRPDDDRSGLLGAQFTSWPLGEAW